MEKFRLKKLSIKGGKVYYEYESEKEVKGVKCVNKTKDESDLLPHPHLTRPFDDFFRTVAVKVLGYSALFDMLEKKEDLPEDEKQALIALGLRIENYKQTLYEGTTVTGIKLNGSGNTSGVVLEGKYKVFGYGKEQPFKTLSITLKSDMYGIEEDLEGEVETLIEEAKKYIFEDKCGEAEEIPYENQD